MVGGERGWFQVRVETIRHDQCVRTTGTDAEWRFPRRITVGRSFFATDGTKAGRLELPQGREDDGIAAGRTPTRRASS
ncbi:MAG: hypothetical protein DMG10_28360 [Acidobacteria bacterium]|nr:MAG: hypothetical protein DMG10_28360 [Acidobacteriota bacterium]